MGIVLTDLTLRRALNLAALKGSALIVCEALLIARALAGDIAIGSLDGVRRIGRCFTKAADPNWT